MSAQTERLLWLLATVAFLMGGYFVVMQLNAHRPPAFDPALPLDHALPFVPAAVVPYALVYPLLVTGALLVPLEDREAMRRTVRWILANGALAFAVYLAWPVTAAHRPEPPTGGTLAEQLCAFYFWLDRPTNLLPSLHVQMALLGGLLCLRWQRWAGVVGLGLAAVIAASVVLVKQHYLADIAAAVAVVWVTRRLGPR
ncbi:MAG: phosphatase PAP2 family protein [Myxococcales bacterium]|nr:phosphatase PAP2 family protein [Myxococcales bacterium]